MTTTDALPTLASLTEPEGAIAFALDYLEPFEVAEFLRDRRDGADLTPYLGALEFDRRNVAGEPLEAIAHLVAA